MRFNQDHRLAERALQRFVLTIVIGIAVLPMARAEDYICRDNAQVRLISVVYDHKGWPVPCRVRYEKPKENSVSYPWRAEATPGYCEDRAKFLADKLSGFGWDCQVNALK